MSAGERLHAISLDYRKFVNAFRVPEDVTMLRAGRSRR